MENEDLMYQASWLVDKKTSDCLETGRSWRGDQAGGLREKEREKEGEIWHEKSKGEVNTLGNINLDTENKLTQ